MTEPWDRCQEIKTARRHYKLRIAMVKALKRMILRRELRLLIRYRYFERGDSSFRSGSLNFPARNSRTASATARATLRTSS
jgi:hypothetical protein